MTRLSPRSVIIIFCLPFFFLVGSIGDDQIYSGYYSNVKLSTVFNYSLDKGYLIYSALLSEVGLDFDTFWLLSNGLCLFVVYSFFKRSVAGYWIVWSFVIVIYLNPYSANIFNNILRMVFAFSLGLLLLSSTRLRWISLLAPSFHIYGILVLVAGGMARSARLWKGRLVFLAWIVLPLVSALINPFLDDLLQFSSQRSIKHNLLIEYVPANRWASIVVSFYYLVFLTSVFNVSLLGSKLAGFARILLGDVLNLHLRFLTAFFGLSLSSYIISFGIGSSARFLTIPVWICSVLVIYSCGRVIMMLIGVRK